jgi:outer membrane protein TolC
MKKILTLIMLMGAMTAAEAQTMVLNLDSCRAMALRNNKQINASKLKKDVATNLKKSARTKYLPKVDAMGGYEWFSKEISLLNDGDELKQVADYITTHVDEDGVKNALIKYGVIAEN